MKLQANKITKMAKAALGHSSSLHRRKINPVRDWTIGLVLGLCVLVGMVAWSSYKYVSNRDVDQMQVVAEPVAIPAYQAGAVADAITYFEQRQQTLRELQGVLSERPDPQPQPVADTVATNTITATSSVALEDVPVQEGVATSSALAPSVTQ